MAGDVGFERVLPDLSAPLGLDKRGLDLNWRETRTTGYVSYFF